MADHTSALQSVSQFLSGAFKGVRWLAACVSAHLHLPRNTSPSTQRLASALGTLALSRRRCHLPTRSTPPPAQAPPEYRPVPPCTAMYRRTSPARCTAWATEWCTAARSASPCSSRACTSLPCLAGGCVPACTRRHPAAGTPACQRFHAPACRHFSRPLCTPGLSSSLPT